MPKIDEVLAGGSFGREVHGAFGGAFGGILAAAAVYAGRAAAPGRVPTGIDCRFVRSLGAGDVTVAVDILRTGRTLTLARVTITDAKGRTATDATVSYADPAALHPLDVEGIAAEVPARTTAFALPPGVEIPVVDLLDPRLGAVASGGIASDVRIPWDDPEGHHLAEAVCVAGDFCVGAPVGRACEGAWIRHPNPDLSLRFTPGTTPADGRITGTGRVLRIAGGVAVVAIEVSTGGVVVAVGCSTSTFLEVAT